MKNVNVNNVKVNVGNVNVNNPTGPLDNDNPSVRRGGQRPSGTTRPWLTMTNEGQSPHHAREAPTLRLASVAWDKAFRGF